MYYNEYAIDLFIPNTQEGSIAAVIAHVCAKKHNGIVYIARYTGDEDLNKRVGEDIRDIVIGDEGGILQPKQQNIWVVGSFVNTMVHDELEWFVHEKPGRVYRQGPYGSYFDRDEEYPFSLNMLLYHWDKRDDVWKNIKLLFEMLDVEEFEHLVAYLLQEHPGAWDITTEDYVLSLFVEHEKNKREQSWKK